MEDDVDNFGYAMDNDVTGPHLVFAIKINYSLQMCFVSYFFVMDFGCYSIRQKENYYNLFIVCVRVGFGNCSVNRLL